MTFEKFIQLPKISELLNSGRMDTVLFEATEQLDSYAKVELWELLEQFPDLFAQITILPCDYFKNCETSPTIKMPPNLQLIEMNAFKDCTSLKNIVLNDGLEKIELSAFSGCTHLKAINLPSTLTYIGMYAFTDNYSLNEIAEKTGFGSVHYFASVFKKHTGKTPKEFQMLRRNM